MMCWLDAAYPQNIALEVCRNMGPLHFVHFGRGASWVVVGIGLLMISGTVAGSRGLPLYTLFDDGHPATSRRRNGIGECTHLPC